MIHIRIAGVFVDDQQKAHDFYTTKLGFVVKNDIPMGEHRWLTVVSPDTPGGTELLLEPNTNAAARTYQEALFGQGIPATMFFVDDISAEHKRLSDLGVTFTQSVTDAGPVKIAVLDDTCGNLIQLVQE